MELRDLVNFIIDIVKKKNLNKVYICGNGSSGKTTLSKALYDKASMIGTCNLISLDDYLVDINLRKNYTCDKISITSSTCTYGISVKEQNGKCHVTATANPSKYNQCTSSYFSFNLSMKSK